MLIYKGFIGQIEYDNETGKLVGEVINCIDVLEFEGVSADEIKAGFKQCIEDYIACQKELTGVYPTPFVGNFTVCLSTDKQNKIIKAAHAKGQSVSHWLNQRIERHLTSYFKDIA
ncbi:hypothetical protein [Aliikangiella maris]|uniref:Type II toxin-antitoxin system HicB family antitoxin n=2 Tax=Aliikangiella maris TaxID=3162458 RepID=A0ABV2BUI1_9GAMM